ncbi:MAG: hypothetical protein ACREP3_13585 [Candidatus Binatia bacterium]
MSYDTGLSMEERVTSLFQPDTLLPDQYLDTFRRKLHLEPEKKLMLAILEDAIACYQKYLLARDSKGKALFREAEEWVEESGGGSVFAFDSVCETLGLNPDYLRRGMAAWTKAALAQRTQAKIYQLAPRPQRRSVAVTRRATRRLRRAAGR